MADDSNNLGPLDIGGPVPENPEVPNQHEHAKEHPHHHHHHHEHQHEHHLSYHGHHLSMHDIHNGQLPHGFHHGHFGHHGHPHRSLFMGLIEAAQVSHQLKNLMLMERNHRIQIINAAIKQQEEDRKKMFVSDELIPLLEMEGPIKWQEKLGDLKHRIKLKRAKLLDKRKSLSKSAAPSK